MLQIEIIRQKKYKDLCGVGGRPLKYDFALIKNKKVVGLIEYNGQQHYKPIKFNNKTTDERKERNFQIQQLHDNFKIEYSIKNSIPLIIIPYWKFNDIEELIIKFTNSISYFKNNSNIIFDFQQNLKYLNELNTLKVDELRNMYKNKKGKIGTLIKYNGEVHNIYEWADKLNLKHGTLWYRINKGQSLEKAMNPLINLNNKKIIYYKEIYYTQVELSKFLNIPETYLSVYLKKGLEIDEIINKYNNRRKFKPKYKIEYNGKFYSKIDLCRMLNIPWTSFSRYIDNGGDIYEIAKRYETKRYETKS